MPSSAAAASQEEATEESTGESSAGASSEAETKAEAQAETEPEAVDPAESDLVPLYVPPDVEAADRAAVDSDASDPPASHAASSDSSVAESSASSESSEPAASESTGPVPLFEPDADGSGWSELESRNGPADAGWDDSVPLYQPQEDPWSGEAWDEEAEAGRDWPEDDAPTAGAAALDLEEARRLLASEMTSPDGVVPAEAALDVVTPGDLDDDLGASALRGHNELGLDLRSVERFRWQCSNALGRRDVTLFANGTVRLRRGPIDRQEMQLDELDTETLLAYLSRLSRIQRSRELRHDVAGGENFGQVHGELGENCRLSLRLPDLPPVVLTMPRLEVPQLGIAQLIDIADELAAFTRPLDRPRQVRADYEPQPGDRLRRKDGRYFRVIGPTSDGGGVELEGLQEPVRIFYRLADLPLLFEPAGEPDAAQTEPVDASEPDVREIVDVGGGF